MAIEDLRGKIGELRQGFSDWRERLTAKQAEVSQWPMPEVIPGDMTSIEPVVRAGLKQGRMQERLNSDLVGVTITLRHLDIAATGLDLNAITPEAVTLALGPMLEQPVLPPSLLNKTPLYLNPPTPVEQPPVAPFQVEQFNAAPRPNEPIDPPVLQLDQNLLLDEIVLTPQQLFRQRVDGLYQQIDAKIEDWKAGRVPELSIKFIRTLGTLQQDPGTFVPGEEIAPYVWPNQKSTHMQLRANFDNLTRRLPHLIEGMGASVRQELPPESGKLKQYGLRFLEELLDEPPVPQTDQEQFRSTLSSMVKQIAEANGVPLDQQPNLVTILGAVQSTEQRRQRRGIDTVLQQPDAQVPADQQLDTTNVFPPKPGHTLVDQAVAKGWIKQPEPGSFLNQLNTAGSGLSLQEEPPAEQAGISSDGSLFVAVEQPRQSIRFLEPSEISRRILHKEADLSDALTPKDLEFIMQAFAEHSGDLVYVSRAERQADAFDAIKDHAHVPNQRIILEEDDSMEEQWVRTRRILTTLGLVTAGVHQKVLKPFEFWSMLDQLAEKTGDTRYIDAVKTVMHLTSKSGAGLKIDQIRTILGNARWKPSLDVEKSEEVTFEDGNIFKIPANVDRARPQEPQLANPHRSKGRLYGRFGKKS